MPDPKFSLIVPTRNRPEQLRRLLGSIVATAADRNSLEIILVIDADDEKSPQVSFSSLAIRRVTVQPGFTLGALDTTGYAASSAPYLMLLTDDVVVRTMDWDRKLLAVMESFPDQVVLAHVNDLIFRDTLCTFPLVTREFCRLAGGLCPGEYRRYRIDDHIHNVFDLLSVLGVNRRIFMPDVIFEHAHPEAAPDARGIRQYTPAAEIQDLDTRLFESLLPERKRLAIALYGLIRERRGAAQVLAADLDSVTDSIAIRRREHARWVRLGSEFAGISGNTTIAVLTPDAGSIQARKCIEYIKLYTADYSLVVLECASEAEARRQRNPLLAQCQTDYLVFIEDSVLVEPVWLEKLIVALKPGTAVIRPATGLMFIDLAKCTDVAFDDQPRRSAEPPRVRVPAGQRADAEAAAQTYKQEIGYLSAIARQQEALIQRLMKRLKPPAENYPPLFEPVYYLLHNPDVIDAGVAPLKHYLAFGAAEGRKFNPLFDATFYLQQHPQDIAPGADPLLHFLEQGAAARRSPHPLFDLEFYLRQNPDVSAAGVNPLVHYLEHGGFEGCWPNPLFDSAFYLKRYPAVADARINPLVHYVEGGAFQGYWPDPLFESGYYLAQNTDVLRAGVNPLQHFLQAGAAEGRRPHLLFDVRYYVTRYPDVRSSGMNPLAHFLAIGGAKGYSACALFDSSFYLRKYPDVAAAGLNPLVHFIETGGFQGYDPNPHFDSRYYLDRNPDVAAAGLNPLIHFVLYGASEGRNPNPLFNVKAYTIRYPDVKAAGVNPLEHFLVYGAGEERNPCLTGDLGHYLKTIDRPQAVNGRPAAVRSQQEIGPISVVIPTRNRSGLLVQQLETCRHHTAGCELEFVVVDDGSDDDTVRQLQRLSAGMPNLVWRSIPKSGPARARNVGADIASHDVILFLGDDIHPANEDFFRVHARLHAAYPGLDFAVFGKVQWAADSSKKITYTMSHIQGRGSEQFDYAHLRPYAFSDWRHFYSANLSVKKAIVPDWIVHGFDTEFPGAAAEDIELGYRISKSSNGLRVYYDPGAVGLHHHHYTAAQFMDRQFFAGKCTRLLYDRHPELAAGPFRACMDAINMEFPAGTQLPDRYVPVIEAIKAWARILEADGSLGAEPWHDDFLSAVFELCALEGFVSTWTLRPPNLAAARAVMVDRFVEQISPVLQRQVGGWDLLRLIIPAAGLDVLRVMLR